jgi:Primase C terminal 2 (PriCT-2)
MNFPLHGMFQVSDEPGAALGHGAALSTSGQTSANDNSRQGQNRLSLGLEVSDVSRYLAPTVDLRSLPIPMVKFPGMKRVIPTREWTCIGLSALADELAPTPAPVIERKDQLPYYIAGTLKDAEITNKRVREERQRAGRSTIGRQRSSAHIDNVGPAVLLDDDNDVFARLPDLIASGIAAIVYSSHSYGRIKEGKTSPSAGGRVVVFLDRPVSPPEYPELWDGINDLLGGGFDTSGRSSAQCYGRHAIRANGAPHRREIVDGHALCADKLIERGRALRPRRAPGRSATSLISKKHTALQEIERARLMGAVRPPDRYPDWMAGAAAFKRALLDDEEAAFQCFDTWSAQSTEYGGRKETRQKFDQVPAEYAGSALPVTIETLHWRARRHAERILAIVYSPAQHWGISGDFAGLPPDSLGDGITSRQGADDVLPDNLTPEDGLAALTYISVCWDRVVFDRVVAGASIPEDALKEASRRSEEVHERIQLAGRRRHSWSGQNLSADTQALADAIVGATNELYRIDGTLVRVVKGASAVERAHKIPAVNGSLKVRDPADRASHRLLPILPSDTEALRELIAEHVAAEVPLNSKSTTEGGSASRIGSFGFKSSAKINIEPDAGVLKDLLKRELSQRVPEINGIITAPVMPDLPRSTNPCDLLQPNATRLVTQPGYDAESGLYLSPIGTVIPVPAAPSRSEIAAAVALLQHPFADFPFASPGEGLDAGVSRSATTYATMLAANRRGLPLAPGLAISSHGEGMSSGKTLLAEVVGTIATGDVPSPATLSPNFTEQRKEILTYLIAGDGCLFLDNVASGTRFDSACLAAAMTSRRYKGRLLGANKEVECTTSVMALATGNALNLAGDLASRFVFTRLDTGLERPEDRSSSSFRITDLRSWILANRQRLVAAVHTIVRGYLQECRRVGGTPDKVVARRSAHGSRFGGPCDVLRDALLWAFPDLPDPFLSFQASAANSSTRADAALVLSTLDHWMCTAVGNASAPPWATLMLGPTPQSPERKRWSAKFQARAAKRLSGLQAENARWELICTAYRLRLGRSAVRSGRSRFTAAKIVAALQNMPEGDTLRAVTRADRLSAVALGRWLKERLLDAPINGLVLRSKQGRSNTADFWIASV